MFKVAQSKITFNDVTDFSSLGNNQKNVQENAGDFYTVKRESISSLGKVVETLFYRTDAQASAYSTYLTTADGVAFGDVLKTNATTIAGAQLADVVEIPAVAGQKVTITVAKSLGAPKLHVVAQYLKTATDLAMGADAAAIVVDHKPTADQYVVEFALSAAQMTAAEAEFTTCVNQMVADGITATMTVVK